MGTGKGEEGAPRRIQINKTVNEERFRGGGRGRCFAKYAKTYEPI